MPRRRTEQERRDLMAQQAALSALMQHPSWPSFEQTINEKARRVEASVVSHTLHSRERLDEEYLYYWRGFVHGLRYLVAVPSGAEGRLNNLLREIPQTEEAA
jgi:hypothetical protein